MNKNNDIWALLPHRGVDTGKSRLCAVLDDAARSQLNCWLLERTLNIVSAWLGDVTRCVVVSPCARTLALARTVGATAVQERTPAQGLNAALELAATHAAALGAQRWLILPCDLPRLDIPALQAMALTWAGDGEVVIASDRRNTGTNALLVDAGMREFAFGAGSLKRHLQIAEARGARARICVQPALVFDLDTEKDFSEWMQSGDTLPPFLARAVRTRLAKSQSSIMRS